MYREKIKGDERYAAVLDLTSTHPTVEVRGERLPQGRDTEAIDGTQLKAALDAGEIVFWGQPIWHAPTGHPLGVELLARWPQPNGAMIMPVSFVGVAESAGLVVELGSQALDAAANILERWSTDRALSLLGVNVNVSPQHLMHDLIGEVRSLVPQLPPKSQLGLEFIETSLASGGTEHFKPLEDLRESGVRVVIDDFGIGYSSLSRLQQFPVSNLKLDRSFVADIASNPERFRFFEAICRMLAAAGYPVTAEGIETAEQLLLTSRSSVQALQGYYFARPAPIEDLEDMLRNHIRDPSVRFTAAQAARVR